MTGGTPAAGRRIRPKHTWTALPATLLLVLAVQLGTVGWPQPAWGQEDADLAEDSVFFPADRASMQRLGTARELLSEQRYDEAVRFLDRILAAPEDFFFQPNKAARIYRSLKTEAQEQIGRLPAKGLASYQLQFGAEAEQLLEAAAREGDPDGLAEVSRRFFHTRAGYEATELLGSYHMEHGRPLAAALCFERLQKSPAAAEAFEPVLSIKIAVCWLRAGMPALAQQALSRLKQNFPNAEVTIAGHNRKLFRADAEALDWLAQVAGPTPARFAASAEEWAMVRGDASRNAPSAGGSPLLNRRWAVPVTNDPQIDKGIEQLNQAYADQGQAVLPGWQPLVVKNLVFMRSLASLVAVDFKTGKRIWKGPTDDAVKQVLEYPKSDAVLGDSSVLSYWLEQRIWEDATYGTMSSDGECVFCVEDVGFGLNNENQRTIFLPNGRVVAPSGSARSYNRLAAYEIGTEGKLKWELPGEGKDDHASLAGVFFLGPPLPLAEHLYVLAEIKGEIRLLALSARTGALQWSQQLAVMEQTILDDSARRTAGVSPSYADGVLVCPTAAGAVVAVDLTTRSLLWGYQYHATPSPNRVRMRGFAIVAPSAVNENDSWADANLTVAGGRALLTPRETVEGGEAHAELHCLDLVDGTLAWRVPREDGLYVGCVSEGQVLVVGRSNLRCYRLTDGSNAWSEPAIALPSGAAVSGRGFYSKGCYYLPLTTAEVLAVNIQTGRIENRSRSHSGDVPGNLVCYRGAVISQSPSQLECFYQLDDLRRQVATALEKNPDDAAALALRGELLLDDSKLDEAVDVLRRSFRLKADTRTRELLVDALLAGLHDNFAAYRANKAELEQLIDQPTQRLAYLRQLAGGLQQVGETMPAFRTYLEIMDLNSGNAEPERIDGLLSARRDRWVQARLNKLWEIASAADRHTIEEVIQSRLDGAARIGPDGLRKFLNYFGSHPLADDAREKLLLALPAEAPLLEREQCLRKLEASAQPERSRAAVVRLARLLLDAGRENDADVYYARLAGPLADLVCLDGKTGRELVAELPAAVETRVRSVDVDSWPTGFVKKESLKSQPGPSYRSFPVELCGPRGPFFARSTIELDQPRQALVGHDGLGREAWRVSLVERNDHNQYGFNPTLSHGRVEGHLLLLSMGFQVLAIDTLGTPGKEGPRVLWRQNLTDVLAGRPGHMGIHGQMVKVPWGPARFVAADAHNRLVGNTGPLVGEFACFQRQRNLVAVDPLTGETLWSRAGIQPGSNIFGDGERLFVTAQNSNEALVLRSLDGEELGHREVPPPEQRLLANGGRVLTWTDVDGKAVLKMRDVWKKEDVWQRQFETRACPYPVDNQAIGVLERQGRFVMVAVADGKSEIDAPVTAEPNLSEVFAFRTPTHDLVVTNRPASNRAGDNVQPVPGGFGNPVINGWMHGFERKTGKLVFSTPVENRSLTFHQPSELPVLVFASQIYRTAAARGAGEASMPRAAVLCIDKRTGRVVYDEQSAGPITTIELQGDPDHHQMTLKTIRAAVRMTFTDQPWPQPAAGSKADAKGSLPARAGRAVTRGMQKWLEALTPPPVKINIPEAKK